MVLWDSCFPNAGLSERSMFLVKVGMSVVKLMGIVSTVGMALGVRGLWRPIVKDYILDPFERDAKDYEEKRRNDDGSEKRGLGPRRDGLVQLRVIS